MKLAVRVDKCVVTGFVEKMYFMICNHSGKINLD